MTHALIARSQCPTHNVTKGDTLGAIFSEKVDSNGVTFDEFVAYNFGVTDDAGVNRALVERVGCGALAEKAADTPLDPALGPEGATGKLYVPTRWKADALDPRREHVVKLKRRTGSPGVAFTALDPWFLPGRESCVMGLRFDGKGSAATKASVAVYASRYSTVTMKDSGDLVWPSSPDLASTVIWSKALEGTVAPGATVQRLSDWRGESTATVGSLKKRGQARYVNVASSPYTVVARYYTDDADKDARLELEPFWLRFNDQNQAELATLEVRWKVHGSARTFVHGQVVITDKDGKVAHRKALNATDITTGKYVWADGVNAAKVGDMPYRAQVQVHTGDDEPLGVALAAMHTEVRLWVHPSVKATPAATDPAGLHFAVAAHLQPDVRPQRGDATWYGDRLATLGYHPGPVAGDATAEDFKRALKDFQRSTPKTTKSNGNFVRLEATGTIDTATTDSLDATNNPVARPRFGEITDASTSQPGDLSEGGATTRLNERAHASGLIVWVNDLHCYTTSTAPVGCDPNVTLKNYRGVMSQANDGKVDRDGESTCRPWIPLAVAPRVLGREDTLARDTMPDWHEAMAGCIGPLWVDWMFTEAPVDLLPIEKLQAGMQALSAKRTRTLKYVKTMIEAKSATVSGKPFPNCPDTYGGVRPSSIASYYKLVFGLDKDALAPWFAVDQKPAVATAVHDDLGQADEHWHAGASGRAGVYFRPSTIAGDGYRVRASLRLTAMGNNRDHPNLTVLAARYTGLPVAVSCVMRMWRRTAIRGHLEWSLSQNPANWVTAARAAALHYRACHVHMDVTTGQDDDLRAETLLKENQQPTWGAIVAGACTRTRFSTATNIAPLDGYLWPWSNDPHLGVYETPDDTIKVPDFRDKFLNAQIVAETYDCFYEPLLTHALDRFEKRTGRYRGHFMVSFKSSPEYWLRQYICDTPDRHRNIVIERRADATAGIGTNCRVSGCGGHLAQTYLVKYTCPQCNATEEKREAAAVPNSPCDAPCTGTKRRVNGVTQGTFSMRCDRQACGAQDDGFDVRAHVATYVCGAACGAARNHTTTAIVTPRPYTGVPMAAFGSALGASFVFEENSPLNWAHEMGHHRHFEHAAGAPGFVVAQHDHEDNPDCASIANAKDVEKKWDRACIMAYGDDRAIFCGKCVLKNRGWRVEGLSTTLQTTDEGP